jgi:uncharacterized membrane protein
MAELESLATEEPLEKHIRRHQYDRLLMLSDGIFAIATTLAALEIRLPEHAATIDEMLSAGGRTIAAYAVSFLIIAVFWVSNRDLFARVKRVDRWLTGLTLAMLCLVAVIPACAHVVYMKGNTDAAFSFYALTMAVCGVLNVAMWVYASFAPGIMREEVPLGYRRGRVVLSLMMPLLFGTMFAVPADQAVKALVPLAVVAVVVRRVVLPRWMGKINPPIA